MLCLWKGRLVLDTCFAWSLSACPCERACKYAFVKECIQKASEHVSTCKYVNDWREREGKKRNNYCCCICILEPNGCCFHVEWSGLHNLAPCQPFWIWNSAAHFTGSSPCNFVCSLSLMITASWHNSTWILFSWQSVFVSFIGGGMARTGISASTLHRKRRMLNGQNTMFIMQFLPYPVAVQVL